MLARQADSDFFSDLNLQKQNDPLIAGRYILGKILDQKLVPMEILWNSPILPSEERA